MGLKFEIIDVNKNNLSEYPPVVCFTNEKHPYHQIKINWIKEQFSYGLKIKLLFIKEEKKPIGFIEYIPGEFCWRAVDAKGYMFIHCLWTNGKKYQHQGLGSILINEAERDAAEMKGIAVVTSDKAFMTNKAIFLKNGYQIAAVEGKEQLLVKQIKHGSMPGINYHKTKLSEYQDLSIVYSDQCPWVSRFIREIEPVIKEEKLKLNIHKITSYIEAQQAPSIYGVFNLIYQGKILADRYISVTRFKNILKNEKITGD
jgi:acetyltransferase (GNAT) family protein